jgi:3-hydroxyisobutyrate dehydrogenase
MAKFGFLGLGAMGAPMVTRLIQAGHQVTVWNRTRPRAETFQGRAAIADTPAAAARDVEAVIPCSRPRRRCRRSCSAPTA